MKKIVLTLVFLSLAFWGQAQELKTVKYPNGKVKTQAYFVNGKAHGLTTNYYETGAKKVELNYIKGELTGPYYSYFKNGKPDAIGYLVKGKKVGIWVFFHESTGNIHSSGKVGSDGKPTGTWKYYNADGTFKVSQTH